MSALETLERFFTQHRRIEQLLELCEPLIKDLPKLDEQLKALVPLLLEHLDEKERFYVELKQLAAEKNDASGTSIATIFESNMQVQSGAIRRFCQTAQGPLSEVVARSFETMAHIIRSRFSTEERAVFPLYARLKP